MHAVRRNTKEFKKVLAVLKKYYNDPAAKRLIKLYALKPTETLDRKILINNLKSNRDVIYEMNYESILTNLESESRKLYREEDKPFYFFKTSAASDWYELPFEFSGQAKKELHKFIKPHMTLVK